MIAVAEPSETAALLNSSSAARHGVASAPICSIRGSEKTADAKPNVAPLNAMIVFARLTRFGGSAHHQFAPATFPACLIRDATWGRNSTAMAAIARNALRLRGGMRRNKPAAAACARKNSAYQ